MTGSVVISHYGCEPHKEKRLLSWKPAENNWREFHQTFSLLSRAAQEWTGSKQNFQKVWRVNRLDIAPPGKPVKLLGETTDFFRRQNQI
jgi:hypothetical protein